MSRPKPPQGGAIGLVEDGDLIEIDIPTRTVTLLVDEQTLESRRSSLITTHGYRPLLSVRARSRPLFGPTPRLGHLR